ncbi:2-hydroxyacid dehydrogenase [Microbacterium excoecariae]|uniref:2-hydroxyacid dehydrogenase n=1 Tax=Microbacterium excoecariae TaxID=2715210 RepID=UPI00140888AF|nr:2-hydroxyacid dehydrogenase [Microbacterium excoecariae]NHI16154.1 2-hydroxyacid dehydrogenase [Microbacterium excoecariae]
MTSSLVVSVPTQQLAEDVRALVDPSLGIEIVLWEDGEAPRDDIGMVVPPYMKQGSMLRALEKIQPRLVQGQAIGFDGVADVLPEGLVYANGTGVHETATAELTLGLLLVAQRGLDDVVRRQDRAEWRAEWTPGLADKRIVLLGYGGVGKAIAARLAPFEVEVVPVASRARVEDGVDVHGIDELAGLLAGADILINVLPGGPATRHLIDDAALAALPDGALVVNVGRGPTFDTDALVDHVTRGRIRVASDVFDPEPLPADHPLWGLDGVFVAPHVGGLSAAMRPRIARLVASQAERLARGERPANIVLGG